MCIGNYRKLGEELENFQVALARTNKIFHDYKEMYKTLQDDYVLKFMSPEKINNISELLLQQNTSSLFGISTLAYYVQSKLSYNSTRADAELMRFLPDVRFLYFFLRSADNKMIGEFLSYTLPNMGSNVEFHIKKTIFDEWLESKNEHGLSYKNLKQNFSFSKLKLKKMVGQTLFNVDPLKKFSIRFLSESVTPLANYLRGESKFSAQDRLKFKKVIFHVHGGGFISMSSASHEPYLRTFARESKAMIFSVDYPLAPLSKAVQTIEIIKKAYLFILVI